MIVALSLTLSFLIILLIAAWGSGRAWRSTALADEALLKLKDAEILDLENERKTSNELMRQGDILLVSKEMQIAELERALEDAERMNEDRIGLLNSKQAEAEFLMDRALAAEAELADAQDRIETLTLENYALLEDLAAAAATPTTPKAPKKRRKVTK